MGPLKFFADLILGVVVDSAFNRKEYEGFPLGIQAVGA